jgi:hypothetical protein
MKLMQGEVDHAMDGVRVRPIWARFLQLPEEGLPPNKVHHQTAHSIISMSLTTIDIENQTLLSISTANN